MPQAPVPGKAKARDAVAEARSAVHKESLSVSFFLCQLKIFNLHSLGELNFVGLQVD